MTRRSSIALALVIVAVSGGLVWASQTSWDGRPAWIDRLMDVFGLGPAVAPTYSGYVEADYVYVTSTVGGTVTQLSVQRGDRVNAGARLFTLDDDSETAARDEAAARLRQAEAQLANLQTGRRPPEIDAILAQRAQAEAALKQSEADHERQLRLQETGVASVKQLQDARAQRDRDRNRVGELEAQLRVAKMPGRDDEIRAAEAAVAMARATLAQAEWRLAQKIGTAPSDAVVIDTLFRPGEVAQAGQPIVQLLPQENLKLRFFVPEAVVPLVTVGQEVSVTCDGCGAPIPAVVRFISPRAEYTPPVIYSREQRARLVFLIEARPTGRIEALRVGQPIDVAMVPR
jgi:HlyD family secretion protein